jgi:hypothetical protein
VIDLRDVKVSISGQLFMELVSFSPQSALEREQLEKIKVTVSDASSAGMTCDVKGCDRLATFLVKDQEAKLVLLLCGKHYAAEVASGRFDVTLK